MAFLFCGCFDFFFPDLLCLSSSQLQHCGVLLAFLEPASRWHEMRQEGSGSLCRLYCFTLLLHSCSWSVFPLLPFFFFFQFPCKCFLLKIYLHFIHDSVRINFSASHCLWLLMYNEWSSSCCSWQPGHSKGIYTPASLATSYHKRF